MRISTSKSEAVVLSGETGDCPLQVGGESLPQVEEFKYFRVLFTSEGKIEQEIATTTECLDSSLHAGCGLMVQFRK